MMIGALAAGGVKVTEDYDPPEVEEPFAAGIRTVTSR
jgi:hypothetical protein